MGTSYMAGDSGGALGAKVCVIGAGSMTFIADIIRDLAVVKSLHGIRLVLMDRNPERLERSYALARRYFEALKVNIAVEKTLDRRECIRDADVVINVAFAIGYTNWGIMTETAERYGYYRGLDSMEWNFVNVYSSFTGYKQYKLALEIADDVLDLSPNAWFLQISNPLLEIATLLYRRTRGRLKLVGYCHGAVGGTRLLASRALKVDPDEIEFQVAGLNHVVFLTRIRRRGEDLYPAIQEWVDREFENFWSNTVLGPWQETLSRAAVDMYKTYGLYPVGDTARSGTWKYHMDLKTKQYWYGPLGGVDSEIGWAVRLMLNQQRMERLNRLAYDPRIDIKAELPPRKSDEFIVDIIDSLLNNVERRLVLNIPNTEGILDVPRDVVVEVPAYISGKSIRPESVSLPRRIYAYAIYPRLKKMEQILEAFEAGSRELMIQILMDDPRTRSYAQAKEAVEAILNLPFNQDMREHYR